HEGFDFNQVNPKSVGSTIVVGASPKAGAAARLMIEAVNAGIEPTDKKFRLRGPPVAGSLARAAGARLGAAVMILETTFKQQKISHRARQHRVMVHRLLAHLEMAVAGPERLIDARAAVAFARSAAPPLRVGIYDGGGVVTSGPRRLDRILGQGREVVCRRLGAAEIRPELLAQFDVVVFPGGSGSRQAAALGRAGQKAVRQFVQRGGGYVGICAGAYLATSGYDWGLKILDARTITGRHWRRGRGTVQMELTVEGARIFERPPGLLSVRYVNGPIVAAAARPDVPDFVPLAYYRSELAENGSPPGLMKGTPAISAGDFGRGRVMSISPHPEQTSGLEAMVRRAVFWAAGR
ncbi:MAG: BPL-N domain-containing protein, partial [Phycisphaerae bacterium]|nr:BPL-N domain-containing protein [Phycisphaerae bacterium]